MRFDVRPMVVEKPFRNHLSPEYTKAQVSRDAGEWSLAN